MNSEPDAFQLSKDYEIAAEISEWERREAIIRMWNDEAEMKLAARRRMAGPHKPGWHGGKKNPYPTPYAGDRYSDY